MIELLSYQFFQNAIIGGCLIGIICSWIGLFLVLRRQVMIVDGAAHTAFGGLALGLLLGIDPFITALIIVIISILIINKMRAFTDSAIALMLAIGFSIGLIIISITRGFSIDIFSYLFGSILTISREELIIISIVTIFITIFLLLFHRELIAITFNERNARIMGIPVDLISNIFNFIIAITIILSIKIVGVILIVALITIPALISLQIKTSFNNTVIISILIGLFGIILGIFISAIYKLSTSGIIVFTLVIIYAIVYIYSKIKIIKREKL